jgi:hypothetical protein
MALILGQSYDALRAGNVPDDKARAAADEVANYEGELSKLRLDMGERFWEMGERISRLESAVRLLKRMMSFVLAFQVLNYSLQFR